jgi:hypothetical protein
VPTLQHFTQDHDSLSEDELRRSFRIAAGARQRSNSRVLNEHILLSHLRLLQPGGPGPRIYIPQEQGGPVIPPGTGFPFHCLLNCKATMEVFKPAYTRGEPKSKLFYVLTVSRPVWFGVRYPSGTRNQFFSLILNYF